MNTNNWEILVVEDDPDGQEVVQRILKFHGIRADTAPDAETALEMLNEKVYNLAILDLALPAMDGWQMLKQIQLNPDLDSMPCIAITAFHSQDVAIQAIINGFAAYFPKPLDPTTLLSEIKRVMDQAP